MSFRCLLEYNTNGNGYWCLMPLSTIYQLYHDDSFIGGEN